MKRRRFLSVVPKSFQAGAFGIVGCATLAGLVIGYVHVYQQGAALHTVFVTGGLSFLAGIVLAVWLLCLGYVYADARQRAMPPVLWTLIALLVPNLLGFLLYFAIRQKAKRAS